MHITQHDSRMRSVPKIPARYLSGRLEVNKKIIKNKIIMETATTKQENQNQKNNQTNQNQQNMKTTIINIPQCVASYTLKTLEENKITCQYIGIDLSGRILMEATYQSGQEKLIQKINEEMQESEKAIMLLFTIGTEILTEAVLEYKSSLSNQKRKYQTTYLD